MLKVCPNWERTYIFSDLMIIIYHLKMIVSDLRMIKIIKKAAKGPKDNIGIIMTRSQDHFKMIVRQF